jgi:hypothetical protein
MYWLWQEEMVVVEAPKVPVTAGKKRKAEQEKAAATTPPAKGAESNKKAKAASSLAESVSPEEGTVPLQSMFSDCRSNNV